MYSELSMTIIVASKGIFIRANVVVVAVSRRSVQGDASMGQDVESASVPPQSREILKPALSKKGLLLTRRALCPSPFHRLHHRRARRRHQGKRAAAPHTHSIRDSPSLFPFNSSLSHCLYCARCCASPSLLQIASDTPSLHLNFQFTPPRPHSNI